MKLLLCDKCKDLFNLRFTLKSCSCGHVKGRYLNNSEAVVNGNGYSIAIGNGALVNAIRALGEPSTSRENAIDKNRISHAWVREHEGAGNPHTKVDPSI